MFSILITGAVNGIGRDAAYALAKRGHTVMAATHTHHQVAPAQKASEALGLNVRWMKLDVQDAEDVARAAVLAPDVLINNAGIGESGPLAEIPLDRVRNGFETNVLGSLALVQAVAPTMIARGQGRIINVSSVAGRIVLPGLGAYHATKFALEAMSDALRMELAAFGIRVSIIEPGKIRTGFNERMLETKWKWLQPDSLFAKRFEAWRRRDAQFTLGSHPTDAVVRSIVHAVESPRPKTRYPAPWDAKLYIRLTSLFPDRLKDYLLRMGEA